MLFSSAFISTFLLASAVLADRTPKHRLSRLLERSNPISYDASYAGGIAIESAGGVSWVSSKFTVPWISGAEGTSAFVGAIIDGTQNCHGMFSAGVQMMITSQGPYYQGKETLNHAFAAYLTHGIFFWGGVAVAQEELNGWYEVFGPSISAGDEVQVTVSVNDDRKTGTATFINAQTGESWRHPLTSSTPLCAQYGLWVVAKISNSIPGFGSLDIQGVASGPGTIITPSSNSVVPLGIKGQASASISGNTVSVTAQS
ncbi:hypothetical protein V8E55_008704 [Tylopilus felleus]